MKFKYTGNCENFGTVYGYKLDENNIVDIPDDDKTAILKTKNNSHFEIVKAGSKTKESKSYTPNK